MLELPTLKEIHLAAERLIDVIVHTPLIALNPDEMKKNTLLKPETLQPISSFKLRGMYNAVASLSKEQRQQGISTISSGNTALALGWTARYFGIPACSVMPDTVADAKFTLIKSYGVEPILLPVEECIPILEHGLKREPYTFLTRTRFEDLDLHPQVQAGLKNARFTFCKPIQAEVMPVSLISLGNCPVNGRMLLANE